MLALVFRILLPFLISMQLTACVSELPGIDAVEVSPIAGKEKELQVSLDDLDDYSSDQYRAFLVSFKNNTNRWIRLDKLNIEFPDGPQSPEVLLGKDLSSYLESVQSRNLRDETNKKLLLSGLVLAGGVAGIAGSSNDNLGLETAGVSLLAGSVTYSVVDELLKTRDYAKFQAALPERHLLKPFEIAPGLATSRWIIVQIPKSTRIKGAKLYLTEHSQPERTFEFNRHIAYNKR